MPRPEAHNDSVPSVDKMIKPPKRRRRAGSPSAAAPAKPAPKAKTEAASESRPAPKPAPQAKAQEPDAPASPAKAPEGDSSRPRRGSRTSPKNAPASVAPDATKPVEPVASSDAGEDEGQDDAPRRSRRRSGRGGRGRRNGSEQAAERGEQGGAGDDGESTGIQSRDDDEAVIDEDRAERRSESADDGEGGEGGGKRRRRRRGGRRRRRRSGEGEDGAPAPEPRDREREQPSSRADEDFENEDDREAPEERPRVRERSETRERTPSDEVSFDPDAEYDPDVFADKTYDQLPIRNSVLKGIHACGFNRPTHIQDRLIPIALEGRDVLGQAKTGTGKTAAFSIPALCAAERGVPFQTIILAPTRELAIQISAEITALGENTPIRNCAVYGGQPIPIQKKKLEQNPEIIVATPGRLMDMFEHRNLHFRNVRQVILDEVDRMLDIGFREDIRKILKSIKTDHQTIFVSATISEEIETLARQFMTNPERLTLTAGALTVQLVDQHYVPCENWYKRRILLHLLKHEEPALTVVFCRTKATVDRVAKYLGEKGIDTQAIHGDMPQSKRNAVMKKLRGGDLSVLVASDLAARGLDVDDITHVINYDLPEDPEVYVHRIGRTARAGRRGHAWSLVLPDQGELLTQIEQLTNVEVTRLEYPDFDPGDPPSDIAAERREKQEKKQRAESMVSRLAGPGVPKKAAANDPRFPGGVVPAKLPPKLIRGKVNTSRGMRQLRALEQQAQSEDKREK